MVQILSRSQVLKNIRKRYHKQLSLTELGIKHRASKLFRGQRSHLEVFSEIEK